MDKICEACGENLAIPDSPYCELCRAVLEDWLDTLSRDLDDCRKDDDQ
jgi:hypothetical protein